MVAPVFSLLWHILRDGQHVIKTLQAASILNCQTIMRSHVSVGMKDSHSVVWTKYNVPVTKKESGVHKEKGTLVCTKVCTPRVLLYNTGLGTGEIYFAARKKKGIVN